MSGTFKTGDRELIKEDHCLQKPFTPTDLLQIIQSFSVTK
jgi:hypothetical protein